MAWSRLDDRGRRHASALALIGLGYVVHYLVFCIPQPFFIEDAAISFAYARNLMDGEGLVTYPGGERVEGFSNPTWTFLVAAFYGLGVPVWTSSKVLGAVLGLATLPFVAATLRRARPAATDALHLLGPLLLAASPQFVIWNASGLENSLFCLLLAAGVHRALVEMEGGGRWPVSGLLFGLLALTRPEGIAYGGIAAFAFGLDAAATRRARPLLAFLGAWLLPVALYTAWRLWYFAWPFPNTYYAKLGTEKEFQPFSWTTKGWKYINGYFLQHGLAFVLPLFAFAAAGLAGWRGRVGLALLVPLGVLLLWDGKAGWEVVPLWWKDAAAHWVHARVWALGVAVALFGGLLLGRPGWRARGLLWTCAAFSTFFALYSGGDWMAAHRWFNLAAPTLLPLLVLGLAELLERLPPTWALPLPGARRLGLGRLVVAVLAVVWVGNEGFRSSLFAADPETSVRDVHRRVRYMTWVQRRLDLDHVTLFDVDMGAHVYFSGWDIVDIAGLVDVPIARHRQYEKPFLREYVFRERNPEFAHVHAGWMRTMKIASHPEWKSNYLEIPGYPIGGRRLHVGNHIRKDIFVKAVPGGAPPAGSWLWDSGVRLTRALLPSPEVAAGGLLYVDTAWRTTPRKAAFRAYFVFEGPAGRFVQAVAPGHDWYSPDKWKSTEEVEGRFRVPVPAGVAEGEYAVSVLLVDVATGAPLKALGGPGVVVPAAAEAGAEAATGPEAEGPTVVPLGLVLQVVSPAGAAEAAEADLAAARAAAEAGDCAGAWGHYKDATRHRLSDLAWAAEARPGVDTAIAACHLAAAAAAEGREAHVRALVAARRADRHHPAVKEQTRALAATLVAEGDTARAAADWDTAYAAYHAALQLDPRLSWARRYAEEARDHRLGIGVAAPAGGKAEAPAAPAAPAAPDAGAEGGAEAPAPG